MLDFDARMNLSWMSGSQQIPHLNCRAAQWRLNHPAGCRFPPAEM